ncbi:DUF1972 domain-containing protein [Marinomonas fungiae]|uniref:Glycosyltransferase involved in cell wall bisynthesis n=1 Tax=Marinomonas fungiae TaxID=1137284 RepID=A0A0K6II63_9GAMM|nr:DUF1972 domain-containing protein [Marinomonas fungiae]CUB02794.1 Glycosyltransferase involved in cell wall bisynthesis [Marinomonas fungiae]
MKKVFVVGTVGIPSCYGGFETLVENLVETSTSEVKYTVFCSKQEYAVKLDEYKGAKLMYLPFKANGIQSIFYDIYSLVKSLFYRPDVVLILGVSGCVFLPIFKLFSGSKVVVNIDGLEWRRDKWGRMARAFLKLSEKLAVTFSDTVISDNQAIYDHVLHAYKKHSEVIAYGGDHAIVKPLSGNHKGYALALCRIEPENNVELILQAFVDSPVPLKFIGNWHSSEFGRQLKATYSKVAGIELIEPVYDPEELFDYRDQCQFYVHGHSAGGTNPSLVEMMFFAKPIFAFDCNFNRYSTAEQAIYFDSIASLKALIWSLDKTGKNAADKVGRSMSDLALQRYTWKTVRQSYQALYE